MVAPVVALVFGLLFAGCLLYVIISYALAFGTRNGDRGVKPRIWRSALVELATTLLLVPLWPFWMILGATYRSRHEGEGRAKAGRRPVILLHGLAMTQTSWIWFGRRLARRGFQPIYATTYNSWRTVRLSARHLRDFVERVCACEDVEEVDIVAHSMGGVVARYYIERLGGAARIGRLVTIASPHRGTVLARIGLVPSVVDIADGSPLYAELGPPHPTVRYTSIWSRADSLVVPASSSSIAPEGVDRIFDGLGHLSLLVSPRVLDAVAEALDAGAGEEEALS
jgi:triacylglycerol esterase/lipase EstA (alpha/beta hydrolase family)